MANDMDENEFLRTVEITPESHQTRVDVRYFGKLKEIEAIAFFLAKPQDLLLKKGINRLADRICLVHDAELRPLLKPR